MEINYARACDQLKGLATRRDVHGVARWFLPAGAEFEHPKAAFWVRHGCAVSADAECAAAVNRSAAELAEAQRAYRRLEAKIHPDDFALFDAGVIAGYDLDGKFVPGPNWDEYQRQQQVLSEDDDW